MNLYPFQIRKTNKTCPMCLHLFLSPNNNQTLPSINYKTCQFNNHNCTNLVQEFHALLMLQILTFKLLAYVADEINMG